MIDPKLKIAFFGGEPLGVKALEELRSAGITPSLIICNPDKPSGRRHELTKPPVKCWAEEHAISVFQPESLKNKDELIPLTSQDWDLFVVVAYSQIMPKWLIELPIHKTINLHPSLLPELRGASPIRTAILENQKNTGVSIMLMDEKMDHGPILAQIKVSYESPKLGRIVDNELAEKGGLLLSEVIPKWIAGDIAPSEQDHTKATYSAKISKEMSEIDIDPFQLPTGKEAYNQYLKICAFDGWPGTFFIYRDKRVKITEASLAETPEYKLHIIKVIPEGKKEMSFEAFLSSTQKN